ncbi:MAG: adenylate kinase [Clostridia bacterium]|nr:adenylate kinase [Clostridia bacterium]
MNVILLGAPGSGKGTQASRIALKYSLKHISTGDIFRENIKDGTALGVEAKFYIDQGHLCPDDLTVRMIKERISRPDCKNGVLLDGFPRTIAQAEALQEFLTVDKVIEIEVSTDKIVRRIVGRRTCPACGGTFHVDFIGDTKVCPDCGGELVQRADDNEKTVTERLTVYEAQTKPLIEFYKAKGLLARVKRKKNIEDIFADIQVILGI